MAEEVEFIREASRDVLAISAVFTASGIYFGTTKGFGVNENGDRTGFNTMIYAVPEVRSPVYRYLRLLNMSRTFMGQGQLAAFVTKHDHHGPR